LILFLLPFGVSMVMTMHRELLDRPLVIAVPCLFSRVNASFHTHHSGDQRTRS
jgi:hypothetical protein